MSDQENLLSKVQKLLALAKDSGASQAEAESAMSMANKLLLKHNLTMADVIFKQDVNGLVKEDSVVTIGEIKEEGQWESTLMATLCEYNLCGCITHTVQYKRIATITVIGSKQNIEIVLYLFDIARRIYRDLSKKHYNAYRKEMLDHYRPEGWTEKELLKEKRLAYRTVWIRSYLKGCVAGLFAKLETQRKDLIREEELRAAEKAYYSGKSIDQGNKFGLMVLDNKKEISDFIANEWDDVGQNKSWKIDPTNQAFNQGVSDGKSTELVGGLESNSAKQQIQ